MPGNAGFFVPECRPMPRGVQNADECRQGSRMPKALPASNRGPKRRLAVVLGRGRVTCLRRSADKGYGGNDASSAEVAPDSL